MPATVDLILHKRHKAGEQDLRTNVDAVAVLARIICANVSIAKQLRDCSHISFSRLMIEAGLWVNYLFCLSRSQHLQYHSVTVEHQHPVSAGIAAFGPVLGLAFGADANTAKAGGLESQPKQRQVAASVYVNFIAHILFSC